MSTETDFNVAEDTGVVQNKNTNFVLEAALVWPSFKKRLITWLPRRQRLTTDATFWLKLWSMHSNPLQTPVPANIMQSKNVSKRKREMKESQNTNRKQENKDWVVHLRRLGREKAGRKSEVENSIKTNQGKWCKSQKIAKYVTPRARCRF